MICIITQSSDLPPVHIDLMGSKQMLNFSADPGLYRRDGRRIFFQVLSSDSRQFLPLCGVFPLSQLKFTRLNFDRIRLSH